MNVIPLRLQVAVVASALALGCNCGVGPVPTHCESAVQCEKQSGVCAGKTHACVDGNPEAVCSALSYGSDYSETERLCDGLDNDCDGVVDVGAPQPLWPVGALNPAFSWIGYQVFRTDGGFVAFNKVGRSERLDVDGHWLPSLPSVPPPIAFDPPSDLPVIARRGEGFHYLQNVGHRLYAVDFDADGYPMQLTDGGSAVQLIAELDSGFMAKPESVLLDGYGSAVYTLHDFDFSLGQKPYFAVMPNDGGATLLRALPGRAPDVLLRPGSASAPQIAQLLSMPDGGRAVRLVQITPTFDVEDAGPPVPVGFQDYALGWRTISGTPYFVVVDASDPLGKPQTQLWDPSTTAVQRFGPAISPYREASLADGDEFLLVAVQAQAVDAGPEHLIALTAEGRVITLATWHGRRSYGAPFATIIDDRKALAVLAFPGPDDAGYFSIMFCR